MRVIFTGDPVELERAEGLSRVSTSMYGVHFPMSAEVDVSHLPEVCQRKLANNPHFILAGVDAPPSPLVLPVGAQRVEVADDGAASSEEAPAPKRKRA